MSRPGNPMRFGRLNDLWFGYRYLSIGNDVKEAEQEYKLNTVEHGPMLGWAFTF